MNASPNRKPDADPELIDKESPDYSYSEPDTESPIYVL